MAVRQRAPKQIVTATLVRRRLALLLLAAAAGGIIALVLLSQGASRGSWLFRPFVAALVVVATGALSWWIWRCPRCGGSLGAQTFVKHCPQCGMGLRPRGGGAA
jgi:hypothetical protein